MPHFIGEPCIGQCEAECIEVCPVDCIHPTKDQWDEDFKASLSTKQLYINPEECIDCSACIPVCPVIAIFNTEDDYPVNMEKYINLNASHFQE